MKKLLFVLICFLALTNSSFAQLKKFSPTKGEITFSPISIIKDTTFFRNAIKESNKRLVNYLVKKLGIDKEEQVDTASILSMMNSTIGTESILEKSDYQFIYKDTIIESRRILDDQPVTSFFSIDIKNAKQTNIVIMSEDTAVSDPIDYEHLKLKEKSFVKFRNEKKIINGYLCFKVTGKYKELFTEKDEVLEVVTNNEYQYATYWVTEQIQSLFHPVCKEKEILEKYYPLEVTYENPLFKGLKTNYKLKYISLSK